jgi:hypothetical protein
MALFDGIKRQLRSVIQWEAPRVACYMFHMQENTRPIVLL